MPKPQLSKYIYWLTIGFLFLPLVILALYSFNKSKSFSFTGFSFQWYQRLFSSNQIATDIWSAVGNSGLVAVVSAAIATLIGTLGAIGLNWYRFAYKKYLQAVSFVPLVLPEIIIGISILIFFASVLKLELGLVSILVAHISFTLPFVILMVMARLSEFDYAIIEAARDLGARERQILWRVILPVSLPGIFSGFLVAMTLSLEDFVVTQFVKGPNFDTLPLYIFKMFKKGVPMEICALSVLMVLAIILLAISVRNLSKYLVKSA
jgi:spermidine/putrescine transport system permease protein